MTMTNNGITVTLNLATLAYQTDMGDEMQADFSIQFHSHEPNTDLIFLQRIYQYQVRCT